jgi:biopolymer transport protein TolQ
MTPTANLSVLTLIIDASLPVQLIMLLLVVISVLSWTVIFKKWQSIGRAHKDTEADGPLQAGRAGQSAWRATQNF